MPEKHYLCTFRYVYGDDGIGSSSVLEQRLHRRSAGHPSGRYGHVCPRGFKNQGANKYTLRRPRLRNSVIDISHAPSCVPVALLFVK